MVCCPLMGEIAINQLSAASKICIPEGSIFQGIAKGSGTRLFFEKNGKRAEDFSMPDADNMIELNGIKSELVISMEEMR